MPFTPDYLGNGEDKVSSFDEPARHNALHETLHIVIARLSGLDIEDVVDRDEAVWTRLVDPHKFTVAALMAPEVYMALNYIDFTDLSISNDKEAVATCFRPEAVEDIRNRNREFLVMIFECPHVLKAISILSARMHNELRDHKVINGSSIHKLIDPILICSPHADDLREKLKVEFRKA